MNSCILQAPPWICWTNHSSTKYIQPPLITASFLQLPKDQNIVYTQALPGDPAPPEKARRTRKKKPAPRKQSIRHTPPAAAGKPRKKPPRAHWESRQPIALARSSYLRNRTFARGGDEKGRSIPRSRAKFGPCRGCFTGPISYSIHRGPVPIVSRRAVRD